MADMIQTGLSRLAGILKENAGQTITYTRPGIGTVEGITATLGRTDWDVVHSWGVETRTTQDFLMDAADLVLGGNVVEPAAGDRITMVTGGDTVTFEVASPTGAVPWRYTSPYRNRLRIHANKVNTS